MVAAGLILILKDGKPRQEIDLVSGQSLSMGKHPSNSIILPDKGIRSEHTRLHVGQDGQALFDSLGHKNVLVNGRLEQGPVLLKDGDLIEVLRKHDGPRQFVYYSKSVGQGTPARKYLQQEQWQLTGPGPSKVSLLGVAAPQSPTNATVLPSLSAQSCLQPPVPAPLPHQHFAVPPPAPPCPPVPWLSTLTHQQQAKRSNRAVQSALLHLQQQENAAPGVIKLVPPLAPPLPALPWVQNPYSAAAKEEQAGQQLQQQQQDVHQQAHVQMAAALPAPSLPPVPFAHIDSPGSTANTQAQQPTQSGRPPQFAPPPAPPPLPPQYRQSQGSNRAKFSSGRFYVPAPQQQQQPQVSSDRIGVKGSTSDMHMLVAQQAAAAALKRQQRSDKPVHRDMLPQAVAAASMVSEIDGASGQVASLQQQLLQKCCEVETLQKQNMCLRAQVGDLQEQLASTKVAVCMPQVQGLPDQAYPMDAADDNPGLAGLEEAVEPTLVLEFPPPAFAAMRLDPTAACITDTAAKAQASIPIQSSMQSFAHSPGSDCHQAQDCNQIVCSVSGETTEAQPKQAALLPCLQLSTAVSRHEADAAVHQQSGTESGGTARLSDGQPEVAAVSAVHATPGTVQQARQQYPYSVKEAVAQRQTLQQQADLSRQPRPVGPQAATPEIEADTVSQRPDSMEGNVVRGKQPSSSETFGLADGQENSPGGHATAADGQAAKHDGQSLSADGQDATTNWPILALAGAEPAVLDETVSEACCVCKCAEDGEIMLLCDKCDQPAHLGCVGLDTVPEGDWFCPSCTSAMVLQGGDAQLNGSTAARKVAAAEAGAEQMQGRTTFCGEVADAGAGGMLAQGKKQAAGKKRKAVPFSNDDTDTHEMPTRKRSKQVTTAHDQMNKENTAANCASRGQRHGKRGARPAAAKRANGDEADTDSNGPRRSTRLAHK